MRTLLSNLPGMAYRRNHDAMWSLSFISDGCKDLLGYTAEEILERGTLADFVVPEDRNRIEEQISKAITTRRPYQFVYRVIASNDKERWLWEQGRPIFDADGQVEALEGFATDISDLYSTEVALRHEQELLASIVNHIPAVVYWKGREGNLQGCNQAYANAVGLGGPSEALAQPADELARFSSMGDIDVDLDQKVLETGQPILDREFSFKHADGQVRRLLVNKMPISDDSGDIIGVVSVHSDVTTLKETEETVRRQLNRVLSLRKAENLVSKADTVQDLVAKLVEGLQCFRGVDAVQVQIHGEAAGEPTIASAGFVSPPENDWLIRKAIALGRVVCHQDLENESDITVRSMFSDHEGIRAVAAFPVTNSVKAIGGFLVCSRTRLDLDAHSIGLLEMLATTVGHVLDSRQRALAD